MSEVSTIEDTTKFNMENKEQKLISFVKRAVEMTEQEKSFPKDRPLQGEIWTVDMGENVGSEMNNIRPCIIVQDDRLNRKLSTTIIIPITNHDSIYSSEFELTSELLSFTRFADGLKGSACANQIKTVSIERLGKVLGALNETGMKKVTEIIQNTIVKPNF